MSFKKFDVNLDVWAEVVACRQTGNEVDYDACSALLGASSSSSVSSV